MLKSLLLITLFITFNSTASVEPVNNWKTIYSMEEESVAPEGFELLQAKYPGLFNGYDPQKVDTANVYTFLMKYTGAHTCSEGDPRLTFESLGYGLCEKSQDGTIGMCFQSATMYPGSQDPCL